MQQAPSRPQGVPILPFESLAVPVLKTDAIWELLLGVGLVLTAVGPVTRPLGSAPLQPGFIPVIVMPGGGGRLLVSSGGRRCLP